MANDLNGFANRMKQMAKNIDEEGTKMVRAASLAALSEVVQNTPVDTGLARGNWQVELNSIPSGTVQTAGSISISIGSTVINGYQTGSVFIANNLPYIQRLNEGHSKQAPANFVNAAVSRATRVIRDSKLIK